MLWLTVSPAEAPTFDAWVARGDTAAANLAIAALGLMEVAVAVGEGGRAARFAELHSRADEVVRRAALFQAAVYAQPTP